jgi:hypothetical protein
VTPIQFHRDTTSRQTYPPAMQSMACAACGAPLRAEDLDRRLDVVTCAHCHAVFDLSRRHDRKAVIGGGDGNRERHPVPLPERFRSDSRGDRFRVSWTWRSPAAFMLLVFAVAWWAFLVNWYSRAMSSGDLFAILFPIAHVAVGIGVAYRGLAGLLNTTHVEVERNGTLVVKHTPLPWWPAPRISASDLEQLYTTTKVRSSKNGTTTTFELHAVLRDHKNRKLLAGLTSLDQALYLEQEIERHLGIRDRPVAGETVD